MTPTQTAKPKAKAKARQKKVTFIARSENQTLTIEPSRPIRNQHGEKVGVTDGKRIEFAGHRFETKDAELIEFLRGHPKFNTTREGSFFELGNAPDEPKPTTTDQLEAINTASAESDSQKIREVLDEERKSHNRDVVIQVGEAALEQIGEESSPEPPQP